MQPGSAQPFLSNSREACPDNGHPSMGIDRLTVSFPVAEYERDLGAWDSRRTWTKIEAPIVGDHGPSVLTAGDLQHGEFAPTHGSTPRAHIGHLRRIRQRKVPQWAAGVVSHIGMRSALAIEPDGERVGFIALKHLWGHRWAGEDRRLLRFLIRRVWGSRNHNRHLRPNKSRREYLKVRLVEVLSGRPGCRWAGWPYLQRHPNRRDDRRSLPVEAKDLHTKLTDQEGHQYAVLENRRVSWGLVRGWEDSSESGEVEVALVVPESSISDAIANPDNPVG
jgi:hypothetical protein